MLLAGRVADELLLPGGWSELAGGISRGISDLPGVRVPYRGLDEWVRTVIPLGGSALVLLAALLAFWPRRAGLGFPALALLALIVLYVVPVVALDFDAEFLRGAVFTLLMVAFLRLEKLRRPDAVAAGALASLATLVALIAAPVLNRDHAVVRLRDVGAETSSSKSTTFTWDHSYGRARLAARRPRAAARARHAPAYWKAENLDVFDGQTWLRSQVQLRGPRGPRRQPAAACARWTQTIRVSIRNLRTRPVHHRGLRLRRRHPAAHDIPTLDGLSSPPRTLRRGDTYTARGLHAAPARDPAPPGGHRLRRYPRPTRRSSATAGAPGRRRAA